VTGPSGRSVRGVAPQAVIETITSLDDPRLAPYRNLRDRDSLQGGQFIAEGEVVVRHLLVTRRFHPVSLLLDETRYAAMALFLNGLPVPVPIFVAPRDLLAELAGFPVHRGCLAAVERAGSRRIEDMLPAFDRPALVVVAAGIANHDNMGGIFRNAAAFGADAVLLDAESCDPLYRKAIRVSAGAALTVPFARAPVHSILDNLLGSGIAPYAFSPGGALALEALEPPNRSALIIGAEGPGLHEDVLARCQTVRISMVQGWDSLNVATAAGIGLHHLRSARLFKSPASP
jgi:tRNA G18 (ribose-2'-O)-methylase SpoU